MWPCFHSPDMACRIIHKTYADGCSPVARICFRFIRLLVSRAYRTFGDRSLVLSSSFNSPFPPSLPTFLLPYFPSSLPLPLVLSSLPSPILPFYSFHFPFLPPSLPFPFSLSPLLVKNSEARKFCQLTPEKNGAEEGQKKKT